MKVLYDSKSIREAINKIFNNNNDRRVAIVAYIGTKAGDYIKNPKGLEIICSPKPGSTDPNTISSFMSKGANIKFSDKLHSKIYWSEKGCVISSANLSENALSGNQIETGILIDSSDFDIDKLINNANAYEINKDNMDKLRLHTRMINKLPTKIRDIIVNNGHKISFLEWYSTAVP